MVVMNPFEGQGIRDTCLENKLVDTAGEGEGAG